MRSPVVLWGAGLGLGAFVLAAAGKVVREMRVYSDAAARGRARWQ
jgi:hypothetical protein